MILRALQESNGKRASREESISQFIKKEYDRLPFAHSALLKHHLERLCESGDVVLTPGGKYKIPVATPTPNSSTGRKRKPPKRRWRWDWERQRYWRQKKDKVKKISQKKEDEMIEEDVQDEEDSLIEPPTMPQQQDICPSAIVKTPEILTSCLYNQLDGDQSEDNQPEPSTPEMPPGFESYVKENLLLLGLEGTSDFNSQDKTLQVGEKTSLESHIYSEKLGTDESSLAGPEPSQLEKSLPQYEQQQVHTLISYQQKEEINFQTNKRGLRRKTNSKIKENLVDDARAILGLINKKKETTLRIEHPQQLITAPEEDEHCQRVEVLGLVSETSTVSTRKKSASKRLNKEQYLLALEAPKSPAMNEKLSPAERRERQLRRWSMGMSSTKASHTIDLPLLPSSGSVDQNSLKLEMQKMEIPGDQCQQDEIHQLDLSKADALAMVGSVATETKKKLGRPRKKKSLQDEMPQLKLSKTDVMEMVDSVSTETKTQGIKKLGRPRKKKSLQDEGNELSKADVIEIVDSFSNETKAQGVKKLGKPRKMKSHQDEIHQLDLSKAGVIKAADSISTETKTQGVKKLGLPRKQKPLQQDLSKTVAMEVVDLVSTETKTQGVKKLGRPRKEKPLQQELSETDAVEVVASVSTETKTQGVKKFGRPRKQKPLQQDLSETYALGVVELVSTETKTQRGKKLGRPRKNKDLQHQQDLPEPDAVGVSELALTETKTRGFQKLGRPRKEKLLQHEQHQQDLSEIDATKLVELAWTETKTQGGTKRGRPRKSEQEDTENVLIKLEQVNKEQLTLLQITKGCKPNTMTDSINLYLDLEQVEFHQLTGKKSEGKLVQSSEQREMGIEGKVPQRILRSSHAKHEADKDANNGDVLPLKHEPEEGQQKRCQRRGRPPTLKHVTAASTSESRNEVLGLPHIKYRNLK